MSHKVAVVTGSNKGIGYAIVKGLCEKYDGNVYLTARDITRGQQAVKELKSLGFNPHFHQLDIGDPESVETFKDYLKEKYGGLDVLVNNAVIGFQSDDPTPFGIQSKESIRVNYYGTLNVCEQLFPILRQNARVVNLTSSFGHSSKIQSPELRSKFTDKNLTLPELNELVDQFVTDSIADEVATKKKWSPLWPSYIVSKVALSALSFLQQRTLDCEIPNRNISVNAVHPGYIETDLSRELTSRIPGALSIEEGAKAPLFLALEADFKGKYVWEDCSLKDWEGPEIELFYYVGKTE
ncbi:unnamed protein product [Ceutorhynchus assimilis]|uniref:Uncharacterized protein n=1 Tax=Ceutorhynchus assimilis TaxID=467358 RepID=A0A9N9QL46_9CUCU|nr:unnamed protein product [Ceutorhynchus assimilis]